MASPKSLGLPLQIQLISFNVILFPRHLAIHSELDLALKILNPNPGCSPCRSKMYLNIYLFPLLVAQVVMTVVIFSQPFLTHLTVDFFYFDNCPSSGVSQPGFTCCHLYLCPWTSTFLNLNFLYLCSTQRSCLPHRGVWAFTRGCLSAK